MQSADPDIVIIPTFGTSTMRTWIEPGPNGDLIGMGESRFYDEKGNLTEVKRGPTGVVMKWSAQEEGPRPWWKFWQ